MFDRKKISQKMRSELEIKSLQVMPKLGVE